MRSKNIQKDLSLLGDKLINSFLLENKKSLNIIDSFFSEKNILEKSKTKKKKFENHYRNILVEQLNKQYSNFKVSEITSKNINSLENSNTLTITTGHQICLYSGSLLLIYKIAQVISISRFLNSKIKNFNYVPVFWLATEDHDFDEISTVNISKNKIKWDIDTNNSSVGEILLSEINELNELYKNSIIDLNFKDKLEDIIDYSYQNGDTLAESTVKFINSIFGKYGLVIIDANKKVFKELFIDDFKNEIIGNRCSIDTNTQISQTKKLFNSYKPQVNPSEINFFKITPKGRKRIRKKKDLFKVDDENEYTSEDLIKQIESNPELFSPNVLMRPLYQERILPNICYVGGPSELGYWMQLKLYFNNSNLEYPILKLRTTAYIIDKKTSSKIKKSGVELKYFLQKLDNLIDYKLKKLSTLSLSFDSLKGTLSSQFNELREISIKTNKSFIGALNAQEKKQLKGIDDLEKKLIKAEKKNHEDQINNIKMIFESLHPNNVDQERYLNFANFYSAEGQTLIDFLVDKVLIPDDKILVINLED